MATVSELIKFLSQYGANDLVEFSTNGKNVFCYSCMIHTKLNSYIKDCDTSKHAKYHNSFQSKEYKAKNIVTIFISKFEE